MKKPIQFINISNTGKCEITKESEQIIGKIKSNLGIICIAGIYRSGKSYLLNRLLGRQDGFELGPTIASCTKGLWIWGEPIKIPEKNLEVLIVDTEGLASAFEDRNESIDMIIFSLSLLLSSMFIYNSMKNIDESAIENLALVLNFAKKIQTKFNELNNYTNNFPSFLWVLRDFALELVDQSGNTITPRQYLENALKEDNINNMSVSSYNKGIMSEIEKKNEIRQTLKLFFKERDCFTLVRPVNDEKKLKLVDKLPTNELRKEFLNQVNILVKKVFSAVRPKQVQGSYMNGKMYLNLVKLYVSALNSDNLPDIKTSWKIVVDQQMQSGFNKSINFYYDEMGNLDYTKISSVEELLAKHNQYKEIALDYLKDFATLNIPLSVCLDIYKKLESKIYEHFINFYKQWNEQCISHCNKLTKEIINEYKKKPELNEVYSCVDYIDEVLKFIDETPINDKKYEVMYPKVLQYFIEFLKSGLKESKTKNEMEKNNLKNEISILKNVNEKTKEIIDLNKETYEKHVKELKDEHLETRINVLYILILYS